MQVRKPDGGKHGQPEGLWEPLEDFLNRNDMIWFVFQKNCSTLRDPAVGSYPFFFF